MMRAEGGGLDPDATGSNYTPPYRWNFGNPTGPETLNPDIVPSDLFTNWNQNAISNFDPGAFDFGAFDPGVPNFYANVPYQLQEPAGVNPNFAAMAHAGDVTKTQKAGGVIQQPYEVLDQIAKDHTDTPKTEDTIIPKRYAAGGVATDANDNPASSQPVRAGDATTGMRINTPYPSMQNGGTSDFTPAQRMTMWKQAMEAIFPRAQKMQEGGEAKEKPRVEPDTGQMVIGNPPPAYGSHPGGFLGTQMVSDQPPIPIYPRQTVQTNVQTPPWYMRDPLAELAWHLNYPRGGSAVRPGTSEMLGFYPGFDQRGRPREISSWEHKNFPGYQDGTGDVTDTEREVMRYDAQVVPRQGAQDVARVAPRPAPIRPPAYLSQWDVVQPGATPISQLDYSRVAPLMTARPQGAGMPITDYPAPAFNPNATSWDAGGRTFFRDPVTNLVVSRLQRQADMADAYDQAASAAAKRIALENEGQYVPQDQTPSFQEGTGDVKYPAIAIDQRTGLPTLGTDRAPRQQASAVAGEPSKKQPLPQKYQFGRGRLAPEEYEAMVQQVQQQMPAKGMAGGGVIPKEFMQYLARGGLVKEKFTPHDHLMFALGGVYALSPNQAAKRLKDRANPLPP